jgi:hypothetical protein
MKNDTVHMRVAAEDKARWVGAAAAAGLSLAQWMTRVCNDAYRVENKPPEKNKPITPVVSTNKEKTPVVWRDY